MQIKEGYYSEKSCYLIRNYHKNYLKEKKIRYVTLRLRIEMQYRFAYEINLNPIKQLWFESEICLVFQITF